MQTPPLPSPSPRAGTTFLHTLQLTGRPSTVEVSRLRLNLFIVDEALPRHSGCVERKVALDVVECLGRRFIAPDLAVDFSVGVCCQFDAPVCGSTFPLTQGSLVWDPGQRDGRGQGGWRKIVGWIWWLDIGFRVSRVCRDWTASLTWRMVGLLHPKSIFGVSNHGVVPSDDEVPRCTFKQRGAREAVDVQLCFWRHDDGTVRYDWYRIVLMSFYVGSAPPQNG